MKNYNSYMGRQEISPEGHRKLLELTPQKKQSSRPWVGGLALAACCLLAVGLWRFAGPALPEGGQTAQDAVIPGIKDTYGPGEVPPQPEITMNYPDLRESGTSRDVSGSLALTEGSFFREMTEEQLAAVFGAEVLPAGLCWEEYEVRGQLLYDGQGQLLWLDIWGEHPSGADFTLTLRSGELPLTCCIDLSREWAYSDVFGTRVAGWSQTYDRNGDGLTDYVCGAEFMAGEIGVRFESMNSPFAGVMPGEETRTFNTLLVQQILSPEGGLSLERLMTTDDIPAWRAEEFSSLAQARREEAFAPYLPTENVPGYGEFYGRLSYQEGNRNDLFVRWSRGLDDVEVSVRLPLGKREVQTVDISDPAGYDVRLYPIPWGDSVPEEYFDTFQSPVFRAEDMSRDMVAARAYTVQDAGDSAGPRMNFSVLHPDGTLVDYTSKGLTVDQVWSMVEETL